MFSSHSVVTRHVLNEADNGPSFFFLDVLLRRRQLEFFF